MIINFIKTKIQQPTTLQQNYGHKQTNKQTDNEESAAIPEVTVCIFCWSHSNKQTNNNTTFQTTFKRKHKLTHYTTTESWLHTHKQTNKQKENPNHPYLKSQCAQVSISTMTPCFVRRCSRHARHSTNNASHDVHEKCCFCCCCCEPSAPPAFLIGRGKWHSM